MTQFERRVHRASIHLRTAKQHYPRAWKMADEYRRGRGRDYPDWPDWCYLPVSAGGGIVADDARVPIQMLPVFHPERIPDAARITALATWRMTQGIYRFDPALYAALADTPIDGDLPSGVLLRLPEWCVYVETPDLELYGQRVHGFWAHLEMDIDADRRELRLLVDGDDAAGLLPIAVHMDAGSLRDGVTAATTSALALADTIGIDAEALGDAGELADHSAGPVATMVNLLLYLCADPEITRRGRSDLQPGNPAPIRTRRHGWKLMPAQGPAEWDVGTRIGAALREAYAREQTGGAAAPTGRTVRPHVRRAHWHTILSGPRKRDDGSAIPSSERRSELRWMPPIAINVDDADALAPTIRPVRGNPPEGAA